MHMHPNKVRCACAHELKCSLARHAGEEQGAAAEPELDWSGKSPESPFEVRAPAYLRRSRCSCSRHHCHACMQRHGPAQSFLPATAPAQRQSSLATSPWRPPDWLQLESTTPRCTPPETFPAVADCLLPT